MLKHTPSFRERKHTMRTSSGRGPQHRRTHVRQRTLAQLWLEQLEDRCLPSDSFDWTGLGKLPNWSNSFNWHRTTSNGFLHNSYPQEGDTAVFDALPDPKSWDICVQNV